MNREWVDQLEREQQARREILGSIPASRGYMRALFDEHKKRMGGSSAVAQKKRETFRVVEGSGGESNDGGKDDGGREA
ncbi:hypothetical protein [Thioalkalivibrio sp. ALE19]|uniref:hypothetical protein n=1 Tax=Thioalkalivibrio sp. ALE19 TaxID=1266909 RepID=UPI0012DDC9B7|nr:hypothetical protein [Thioalkalivibrio sp. ALE19]